MVTSPQVKVGSAEYLMSNRHSRSRQRLALNRSVVGRPGTLLPRLGMVLCQPRISPEVRVEVLSAAVAGLIDRPLCSRRFAGARGSVAVECGIRVLL